jgi:hypothetical protein
MSRKFVVDGGVRPAEDGSFTVWCEFTQIGTELEATLMSRFLQTVVHGALNSMERIEITENIVDTIRYHLADVHGPNCDRRTIMCTCHYDKNTEEIMREAAARIEVAIEALTENNDTSIKRALYALIAPRPEPFKNG